MGNARQHYHTDFVQEHVRRALDEQRAWTHGLLDTWIPRQPVESPLEAAFLVWFNVLSNMQALNVMIGIIPQAEVEIDGARYRFDFVIEHVTPIPPDTPMPSLKLAVELDGHEFHERTKEQVEHRNRRDRACAKEGWLVLHFSGSEFNRDPVRCVEEVQKAALRR